MHYARLLPLALVALFLVNCSLSRPATERRSYLLQSTPDAMAPTPLSASIRIAPVTVAPAFEGRSFVYRTGERLFETDYYNEFLIVPRAMVTGCLLNWFQARGIFKEVYASVSPRRADFLLDSHVSALYGDFRTPSAPVAAVEIRLTLSNLGKDGEHEQQLIRTLSERIPLTDASAEALAQAYDTALNRIMQHLEQDILAYIRNTAGMPGNGQQPSQVAKEKP